MEGFFIGQIILVSFNNIPQGFVPCEGQSVSPRNEGGHRWDAVYSLLGDKFGYDFAKNEFKLPDLRGKSPDPSLRYLICVDGVYPTPQ
ncbi:tail fiber protein [Azospirillum doebereinerae]|uniref:Tail fiber protein n=1 Tax=Azospirillum doebereinerae TaxID=92933 RepID=A0A3S0WMV5_9PROT|nr:tail fiber protein [Azospirillum doebereinerae]RUQ72940.1 tail fiber protein [Azospirillum doebereinerae]